MQAEFAVEEVQGRLADIWSALASGEAITFTRNGVGVAEMVPNASATPVEFKDILAQLATENDTLMP